MSTTGRTVRRSVSLPASVAAKVGSLAKRRRVSSSRILVELIETGIRAEERKHQEFMDLAKRFRESTDPDEVQRLGEELGSMVFGD